MKRTVSLVIAVLATGLLPVTSTTAATQATTLPIGSVRDMLVDTAHGKVFLSGNEVAFTDLSGNVLGTIPGFTSASDMAFSPDGSQIYVIDGTAVVVVDASTTARVKSVSLGSTLCPATLAPASGKVFFMYRVCGTTSQPGSMGAVDLNTGVVTTDLPVSSDGDGVQFEAIPGQPNALAARLGRRIALLDTSGGLRPTATVRASVVSTNYFGDMAVTANGAKVLAGAYGTGFGIYSASDLTKTGTYPATDTPGSVAVRADGLVAAVSSDYDYAYLRIYKPGATAPLTTKRYYAGAGPSLATFGAKYLYAVFKKSQNSASTLAVLTPGPPAALTLTTDRSVYPWRGDVTVVAKLSSPTTSRKVNIYIKSYRGTERLLKSANVSASSRKLVVTVPDLKINTTFRAAFNADGTYDSAVVSTKVKVTGKVRLTSRSTSVSGIYHRLPASSSPAVTGLVSAQPHGCTRVIGYRMVSGAWSRFDSISCIHQNQTDRFTVALIGFPAGTRLKVTARFLGTEWNAPSPAATYYVLIT